MPQFRKKPVVIDAFQWKGNWTALQAHLIALGCGDGADADDDAPMWENDDGSLTIPTLEGEHRCDLNDWIIRGVKGEFYPCKPDIFAATYESAEDAAQPPPSAAPETQTPTCKECGCRTGGGPYCYEHSPYTVWPKADGSFVSDRNGRERIWLDDLAQQAAPPSAGVTPRVLEPQQVLKWAAQLVRIVCGGDLARNVDDEVCEPVRRVALEMRDAAQAVRESVPSVPAADTPKVNPRHAEWWVCFHCWKAYYVPTSGFFGDCPNCHKPTTPWHADPNTTLSMTEWRRPAERPTKE